MMPTRTRRRSAWLGLAVLLGTTFLLASAATLHAQVLSDPRIAEFDPSPDHWAMLGSGQPAVLKYELDVYLLGSSTPLGTVDMGKPSPDADGKIRYDFSTQIASWTLPGGNYEARVSAVGPEGEALSDPSNPFTFTSVHSCAIYLTPESVQAAAGGGRYAVTVATAADCAWSAAAGAAWLQVVTGGGPGNGRVEFDVAANTATATRSGTMTIGDVNLVVSQAAAPAPCTYSLSPASYSAAAGGASTSFGVTASSTTCSWTATPSQSWITVTGGSATGNGTVNVAVAANTSTSPRTGSVTVQGQTFTITQAAAPAPCTYSLSPASYSAAAGGAGTSFGVTASSTTCSWTATPSQSWITVTGGSATGNGTVNVAVAANTSTSPRTGSVTVQGQTFTITQAAAPAPCTYSLSPGSASVGASGGTTSFGVTTGSGCSWSAATLESWIIITSASNGTVTLNVAANTATTPRTGTVTVQGQTFTVNQGAAAPSPECSFSITPAWFKMTMWGGTGEAIVTTGAGCAWTVVSSNGWVVPGVRAGTGNGRVPFSVKVNWGTSARTGTLAVGPWTVTVNQDGKPHRSK